jgi:hypothetical protein
MGGGGELEGYLAKPCDVGLIIGGGFYLARACIIICFPISRAFFLDSKFEISATMFFFLERSYFCFS